MNLIAAVDGAWHIGLGSRTAYHLPQDLHHFRRLTYGGVVVMGRKTFETLPHPLEGRVNLVLSRCMQPRPDIVLCRELSLLPGMLRSMENRPVWVIGGAEIYRLLLPYCTCAHMTYTERIYPADCTFPTPLPALGWMLESEEPVPDTNGEFQFRVYRNPALKTLA